MNTNSNKKSFTEEVLRMGGKSKQEVETISAVDFADEEAEHLFGEKYQTLNSPLHQLVWGRTFSKDWFFGDCLSLEGASLLTEVKKVLQEHRDRRTTYNKSGKVSQQLLEALGEVGYWGALIKKRYGGKQLTLPQFMAMLTEISTLQPTVAGLASVHGCIGAVDPITTFGTQKQKEKYLPGLATGDRLSAFALTEPGAGSDLTALKTVATEQGEFYSVTGEKLFITNAKPGRTIALVCKIDQKPAVLICDLPEEENEQFQLVSYGLHAIRHSFNYGLKFNEFLVPKENLLTTPHGDGLTIAYHGLNRGRVALAAMAAGSMQVMLRNMLPWAKYRKTYGKPILQRELVEARVGRMASLIVATWAMRNWCSSLLEKGYRGELECIIAKVFSAEALKESAIELFMKTHGGRSFLKGHLLGDNLHDFLAPSIYEGESDILSLAFMKGLLKEHGKEYFYPIGKRFEEVGIQKPNMKSIGHLWSIRKELFRYGLWRLNAQFGPWVTGDKVLKESEFSLTHSRAHQLLANLHQALTELQKSSIELSELMQKHQLRLADRQCALVAVASRIQQATVVLTTSLYGLEHCRPDKKEDQSPFIVEGATFYGMHALANISEKRLTGKYYRGIAEFGRKIASGEILFEIEGSECEILMPYV
ncbi:MAG: acyl-CoA/acyl-ACP dehydrogenase [Pirellulaceae bacterium]|nr:acyl-CoA/acyl-ACP dehydrogenase [Pirellulaceae bacterium]